MLHHMAYTVPGECDWWRRAVAIGRVVFQQCPQLEFILCTRLCCVRVLRYVEADVF
jgi:hypothetical protein